MSYWAGIGSCSGESELLRCIFAHADPFSPLICHQYGSILLLMVAHLPYPVALPCLNESEANFAHRDSHCAICWAKHTGPLLKCHDGVCLDYDKSLQAVTRAVLWYYSQQRGAALMPTDTGERGSFTTHPFNRCQYSTSMRRDLSLRRGHVCICSGVKSYSCSSSINRWMLIDIRDNNCKLYVTYLHSEQSELWRDCRALLSFPSHIWHWSNQKATRYLVCFKTPGDVF